ncbi:MAG TPA: hypothetical protein DCK95_01200 [Anaerolineaceae bacterium]|nr:hypothetical protein [Anaerolineaceae bacterium]
MINKLSIEYCVPCQFEKSATDLAAILQDQFGLPKDAITLIPSKKIGTFEVMVNDELIYSKQKSGRLPQPDEIINLILLQKKDRGNG